MPDHAPLGIPCALHTGMLLIIFATEHHAYLLLFLFL